MTDNTALREQILGFDAGAPIPVDAFGTTVYVKPLSGADRDAYEQSNLEQTRGGATKLNLRNARARLVALCLVDEHGKRLFGKADIDRLGKLPAAELDKVADVARDASGLDAEDEDALVDSFDEEDEATPVGVSSS